MQKLLVTLLFAVSCTGVFAQKLEDVQEKISKGKYDEAKTGIDQFLADPKNQTNASAWYHKGKIYAELARRDSAGTLASDPGKEAFEAFRKYQEMDKMNKMMALEQNVGLFQLYDMYYNQGIRLYNQKDYEVAFSKMKNALDLEDYISKKGFSYNGFSFPVIDTQLINLTASSAYLAKKDDQAMPLWERLADAKIKEKDFRDVYALLAEYYAKKNNLQKADKYLSLGKELYGDPDFWVSLEYDFTSPGKDTIKRFARYEQMLQKYPNNYALAMDYAIEQFNYTYSNDKKPVDYAARQDKLTASLTKALAIRSTAIGNFVMAQHLYYQIYDLEDAERMIKGTGAADQAKKKDIGARISQKYEEFYPYALKAYDMYSAEKTLKTQDKINLRKTMEQLADYHDKKKQEDKAGFYRTKLNSL